jgi:fucose 4-O-acetylase-like acetyltransferase
MPKERNQFVDIMRGIAMLLVVLDHTMTGCTVGAEKSFLFNIVWSLQMPLFILISGYVTRYSPPITTGKDLLSHFKRRTLSYMLPWAVWSFLIRGLLFGQSEFLNVKHLLWNMDSGYWFLATIWTISLIFGTASFAAEKIGGDRRVKRQAVHVSVYLLGMALLAAIGFAFGLSFFAIKLTLYYMPFFYAGYLYGQYRDRIMSTSVGKNVIECVVAACFVVWLFVILRYSLYEMSDGGVAILLRAGTSLAGCIAVCGLCKGLFTNNYMWGRRIGQSSMEIYLTHYLLLNLIKPSTTPMMSALQGLVLTTANYIVTLALTMGTVALLRRNRILRFLLFGKWG